MKPNDFTVLSEKKCRICKKLLKLNPVSRKETMEICYGCYTYERLRRGGYVIPAKIMRFAH